MIGDAMFTTIKTLWEQGNNKSEIAKMTGHDWKTVHKIIKQVQKGFKRPLKKPHPSKLDDYKDKIIEYLEQDLTSVRIHEELSKSGLSASYSLVKSFVANTKKSVDVSVRFHTKPGEEAQVDFGYVGMKPDANGKKRKAWVFNMRLSYSRLDYYEVVFDQTVETFIRCHKNAFKYFGGVPETIKLDNLKAAILNANFYEPIYQKLYLEFSIHYGFKPLPCRVRQPKEKGKVESGIKYFKLNFISGRKFKNNNDLNFQMMDWLDNKCNARTHGTTQKIPCELFKQEEKEKLRALPIRDYIIKDVGTRKVQNDCHVYINYNYYSVPFYYVGKYVEIEIEDNIIRILFNAEEIAVHAKAEGKGVFTTINAHYPVSKYLESEKNKGYYKSQMENIGEYASTLFNEIIKKQEHHWYKTVTGILSLRNKYADEIINKTCYRALVFDIASYRSIKNMCKNNSYKLPIDINHISSSGVH